MEIQVEIIQWFGTEFRFAKNEYLIMFGACVSAFNSILRNIFADFNFNRSLNCSEWKSILCTICPVIELLCLENGSRLLCQSNKTPCNLFINLNQNQNQINGIWLIIIIWMNIANSNTLYSHHVSSIVTRIVYMHIAHGSLKIIMTQSYFRSSESGTWTNISKYFSSHRYSQRIE